MAKVDEFDVCVVGGGVMGSCAAYSLAELGKSTVLIEQFPIPHSRGSSRGHSRITSMSDYSAPYMAKLVHHGYRHWVKLIANAEVAGIKQAPLLTVSRDHDVINAKAKKIEDAGFLPVFVDVEKVNTDYRSQIPSDRYAVIDPSGMILVANKCVLGAQKLFQNLGGVILDGWTVKKIQPEGASVRVICPKGVIRCNSLVLCPGPWAKDMLASLGVDLPLSVVKTGMWYYKLRDPSFPITSFNDLSIENEFFYSTAPIEYPGMIKFGIHRGVEVNPDELAKGDLTDLKEKLSKYLEEFFPQIEPEPSIDESCMYTNTPDEDFILDYHPHHKNIVYACGFSGRGFQLAPVIGEILAHKVLGLQDIHDLTPFRASRFNSKTQNKA